ncbi:sensor histidine kinase [Glutamicibacter uratoxydans]|uniref:sensor histidine kinase n=1 Tax=Glutamicibacter uratoxydans TaxID=43667 RepID=UPI003D6E5B41
MAEISQRTVRNLRRLLWLLPLLAVMAAAVAFFLAPQLRLAVQLSLWLAPVLLAAFGLLLVLTLLVQYRKLQRAAHRLQTQLREENDQARRRLLRRLDHELKNPLTVLETVVSGSENGMPDSQSWESVATQTRRLSRLVGDLRGLAELEIAQLERIEVDLESLLRDVLDDTAEGPLGAEAEQRKISLHLPKAPWPLPLIKGDPDLLRLSLQNLVSNAIKYSEPQDSIEITAQELDGWVIIDIADTGRGIPQAEQELVLEELARGSNARDKPGSGIGLALVRVIVSRHGGSFNLRSRDGHGTSVSIRLPLVPTD